MEKREIVGLSIIIIALRSAFSLVTYEKHHENNLRYISLNTMKDMVQYLKPYKIYFL